MVFLLLCFYYGVFIMVFLLWCWNLFRKIDNNPEIMSSSNYISVAMETTQAKLASIH